MFVRRNRSRSGNVVATVVGKALGYVIGGAIIGGAIYYGINKFVNFFDRQHEALRAEIAQANTRMHDMERQLASARTDLARGELRRSLSLVNHRLARIDVLGEEMRTVNGQQKLFKHIRFREVEERVVGGQRTETQIGQAKDVWLPGNNVVVDGRVIMFNDDFVESGDNLRGTSVALLERLYTDDMRPNDAVQIDTAGARPAAYRPLSTASSSSTTGTAPGSNPDVWARFWRLAHNNAEAERMGIRTMHGQVVSMRADVGRSYKVSLRASGGLAITPDGRVQTMALVSTDQLPASEVQRSGTPAPQASPSPRSTTLGSAQPVLAPNRGRNGPGATDMSTDAISWERDGYISDTGSRTLH
jgi:hypothetical protein